MNASEAIARPRESNSISTALDVLRRRWPVALAAIVVCVGYAAFAQTREAKTYKATASVAFESSSLSESALGVASSGSSEPQREADTQVTIAHSPEVAAAVNASLRTGLSIEELRKVVTVEAAPNADVLEITAQTSRPSYAALLANRFATAYIEFRRNSQLASINAARAQLQHELSLLPAGSPEAVGVQQSLQRVTALSAVVGAAATIVGRATPPSSAANMRLSTALAIGLLVGLALAFTLVFLVESLDRSVKSVEEFEREYRAPALTVVPQSCMRPVHAAERTELLEPYRILRSALEFAAVTRTLDTLLVTSAMPGEGKTTVAVDLAHAVALTGREVVLIELDLRVPTFARHFGISPRSGLTTALLREKSPRELMVRPLRDVPNLSVLPAGRLPPNPSELIASLKVSEMISELADEGVMVIVDSPPLNPVADTQTLLTSSSIHATLVVARIDWTDRREVRRARAILDRHMIEPLGLVITGSRDAKAYVYAAADEPAMMATGARSRSNGGGKPPRTGGKAGARDTAAEGSGKRPDAPRRLSV